MSQAVITKAFTEWKAQQAINNQPVTLDEFVFAYIPNLDVSKPISNTETLPAADKIVHRQAVSKSGVVNGHSVVYSVTLGADTGDFDFNWIGLTNKATSTLAMIIHAPTQRKVKNASGQQGNVLVRSMLMEYSGAQSATQITTPAETWQIDFTARLAAMDERHRLENIDLYGAAAFFDTGYLVAKNGSQFYVTKGAGYVAGLRADLVANQNITISAKPVKVWLDVSWSGTLTSVWAVNSKITVATSLADYAENGTQHYVFALASIDASGNITDLRPKGGLNDQALKEHEKSRNHPDATTKEKGFVQLSSETGSDDESKAATPKAVKAVNDTLTNVKESLGTASKADVVTSTTDTTAGRVPVTGWMGLGAVRDAEVKNEDFSSFWRDTSIVKSGITIPYDGTPTVSYLAVDGVNHHAYVGRKKAGEAISWVKLYSEFNKPTAADVDAVSATNGGTFSRGVTFNQGLTSKGQIAWGDFSNAVGSNNYNAMANVYDANGKMRWAFGPYKNGWSIYSYDAAGGYVANLMNIDYTTQKASFSGVVSASGEFQTTAVESYRIAYGNIGTFWRNDGSNLYLLATDSGDAYGNYNSLRPFYVALATGKVTMGNGLAVAGNVTINGQVVPSNYGNLDARYQLRGSYAAPNAASKGANGWWQCGSTGIIDQWLQGATMTSETTQSITFPKAFPNACLGISVSTLNVNNNTGTEGMFQLVSKTRTGCVVMANRAYGSIGQVAVLIRAVGY